MNDQAKPMPMDLNALAYLLGMKDIENLQLRHQVALQNQKIEELQSASPLKSPV